MGSNNYLVQRLTQQVERELDEPLRTTCVSEQESSDDDALIVCKTPVMPLFSLENLKNPVGSVFLETSQLLPESGEIDLTLTLTYTLKGGERQFYESEYLFPLESPPTSDDVTQKFYEFFCDFERDEGLRVEIQGLYHYDCSEEPSP